METYRQKPLALFVCLLLISSFAQAGNLFPSYDRKFYNILNGKGLPKNGTRWPVGKGSVWTGISMGARLNVFPKIGSVEGFPLFVWGDYSYSDHMSIGGYLGHYLGTYQVEYGVEMYESKLNSLVGGVRWTFHFADIFNRTFLEVVNPRKVDLYATAHAGFVQYNWAVDSRYQFHQNYSPINKPSAGLVLGIRYLAHPKMGILVEGGKGVFGWCQFGLTYKLVK